MLNVFQIVMLLIFTLIAYKFLRKSNSLFDVSFTLGAYILAAAFLIRPTMLIEISNFVGIGRGVDLFLYAAIFVLFALVFKLFLAIDKNRQDISKLNRKLTIFLKDKIDK